MTPQGSVYDKYSMAAVRILETVGKPGTITEEWIFMIGDIIRDELSFVSDDDEITATHRLVDQLKNAGWQVSLDGTPLQPLTE